MNHKLAAKITSYDLLKTFAVVTMLIDHIGHYFYPEDIWWRAIGRLSGPVWIFLIGYARSRDLPVMLLVGAVVLAVSHYASGHPIPLNILVSFVLVRLMVDKMAKDMLSGFVELFIFTVILIALIIPSYIAFDYGTLCFLIAMCGFMARNEEQYPLMAGRRKIPFFVLCFVAYAVTSIFFFNFNVAQSAVMSVGLVGVCVMLYRFRPIEYPGLEARLPAPVKGFLNLCGHYTLEIYILHILLFMTIKAYLPFFL